MAKKRRVFEQGHGRKLLVIVDETPEVEGALFYAAGRIQHTGGRIQLVTPLASEADAAWGLANVTGASLAPTGGHPVVRECRGLVLHAQTHDLVARSFPRFFNWGEMAEEMKGFDFSDFTVHTKEDGSLVLLYFFAGQHINGQNLLFVAEQRSCKNLAKETRSASLASGGIM